MKKEGIVLLAIFVMMGLFLYPPCIAEGIETAPRITDREIIESLADIRGDIKAIDQHFKTIDQHFKTIDQQFKAIDQRFDAVDQRFKAIDQRFDAVNQRFDVIDQRFDVIDQRFDELRQFMLWGFGVTFAGIFSLIGFVLWDRRTALTPVIRKNIELEDREERIERVLKGFAEKDPRFAEVLKHFGLM